MVRLKDIARAAGVSVMTVSRVLRDAPSVKAATKSQVLAQVALLGYVPDAQAQGLRTRATKLFGLVLPTLDDPAAARIATAIEERTHALGCDLLISQSLRQPAREEACLRRFLARRVEGLYVLPSPNLAEVVPVYEELTRRGVRVVWLGPKPPFAQGFANVETDESGGAAKATKHLLELGHRHIAFLAGPAGSLPARQRLEGYRRAVREVNSGSEDRWVFGAGSTFADGEQAARQMIREDCPATAVQAVNDLVAMGAASVFLEEGRRLPAQLSIVGFGNMPGAGQFRIPLTTVRQPKYRLGVAAAELMLHLCRGGEPKIKRLATELLIRASTAPLPVPARAA